MIGIFYDPGRRRLVRVEGESADPDWTFVTHRLDASAHHCRRILREFLCEDDLFAVDWSGIYSPGLSRLTA